MQLNFIFKIEKYADIDKVLKVEDDEKTVHVSSTYSKQPDFNYDNESKLQF